ncbi:hypothetical protein CKM354_000537900 [Cercospora kikuchii]|uniref:Uncharacterized protein n=1 Tax=Cercospora kikuchii TaxID=84275 RepID=A0A9P3CD75_9PEZI|nr:uncharacterized protein CKM354_000537900 [Cercospora kikuchii]GIZ42099.1 hypothetical protein CKM354_000537900 [Cercospora kikuchii]
MGIILSTTRYAPFAFISGIIGIVSFVFTLTTWLKVLWTNFETMGQAPHEVHAYLTNIRTELLEEELASASCENNLDDATLKTMGDTVKYLMRQFQDIEQPFLKPGSDGIAGFDKHERQRRRRKNSSISPYYEHSAYASPTTEKGDRARSRTSSRGRRRAQQQEVEEDDAETYWAQRTQYRKFGFACRFAWLKKKSQAQDLFATLSRVQIRRIARQVGGLSMLVHQYGGTTARTEEMLMRIEDRLSNIVGVRRIE